MDTVDTILIDTVGTLFLCVQVDKTTGIFEIEVNNVRVKNPYISKSPEVSVCELMFATTKKEKRDLLKMKKFYEGKNGDNLKNPFG